MENRLFKKINNEVRVIFLSSDMVFQGGKNIFLDNSKRRPKNSYGESKRKIEDKLSKYFSKLIILRLPKIYSDNLKDDTIYSQIIKACEKNNKIIFQSENALHEFKGFSSNNKKF